jgi:hypothetical protein
MRMSEVTGKVEITEEQIEVKHIGETVTIDVCRARVPVRVAGGGIEGLKEAVEVENVGAVVVVGICLTRERETGKNTGRTENSGLSECTARTTKFPTCARGPKGLVWRKRRPPAWPQGSRTAAFSSIWD